jgi:FkbM family methyltransferase
VVVDCGSAGGIDPIFNRLSEWGVAKRFGFEPNPAAFKKLSNDHVTTFYQVAISDHCGRGELSPEGVLEKRAEGTVEIDSLDNLIAESRIPVPDIVKTDIEGHDFIALSGADKCLQSSVLCVKVEINFRATRDEGGFSAIHDLLTAHGFRLFGVAYSNGPFGDLQNSDLLYLRSISRVPDRRSATKLTTIAAALGFLEYAILCVEKGYTRGFFTADERGPAVAVLNSAVFLPEIIPWTRFGVRMSSVFSVLANLASGRKWGSKSMPKANQLRRFSALYASTRLPWIGVSARQLAIRIRRDAATEDGNV